MFERIRRVLSEPRQVLQVFDQDAHSVTGPRTLKEEFEKVASHNEKHLGQIRAALGASLVSEGRRP